MAMIPALGAGGPEFKSRIAPNFYQNQISSINRIIIWSLDFLIMNSIFLESMILADINS